MRKRRLESIGLLPTLKSVKRLAHGDLTFPLQTKSIGEAQHASLEKLLLAVGLVN